MIWCDHREDLLMAAYIIIAIFSSIPDAQGQTKRKLSFFDSLDHKLDMSEALIDFNGFIPVPMIVTEPALGGFGLGVAPVFITRRPPTVSRNGKSVRTPPDVTGILGMYSVNNTWAVMAFRQGTWLKAQSKYSIGGGYADVNMEFYPMVPGGEERGVTFNLRSTPLKGSLLKRIGNSPWSAGLGYTFLSTKVSVKGAGLPDFVRDKEINSRVSMPALIVEFDSRDNIFTPDKGVRGQVNYRISDDGFGSDYNYQNLNAFVYGHFKIRPNVIAGLRYEMQQVFGDVPFYLEPFVDLRGVPVARYQGDIFSVAEAEVRWDVVRRWSVVGFGGAGKAYDSWSAFSEADWAVSGGGGFRYLIARKFKLRAGVDVARGPEQWAYYIVFGSAWRR